MTLRSLTQVALPMESIRELEAAIHLDQDILGDVQAAVVELSSRIQHRTSLLRAMLQDVSSSTQTLQEGCKILEARVEQMAGALHDQQIFMEQLREQSAEQSRVIRQRLEEQHSINGTLDSRVHALENSTIMQTGAVMAATMEQLDGKFSELARHLAERVDTLEGQARRTQSNSADLERMLAKATQEAEDGSSNETLVRMLRERMDQILLTTDQVSARVDAELATLTQRVEAVADQSGEAMRAGEQHAERTGQCLEQLREELQDISQRDGPSVHEMSPDMPTDLAAAEDAWWGTGGEAGKAGEWTDYGQDDAWTWQWTEPPGLPPQYSKQAAEHRSTETEGSMAEAVPHGRWKVLMDIPSFSVGGGEAWECNMRLQAWWLQFQTISTTVSPGFGAYVQAEYAVAEQRHQKRLAGQYNLPDLTP